MSAFRGRRVLITGHTGFKGSWLTVWLSLMGARLYGLALPPDEPSLFTAANVEDQLDGTIGDIRDAETVNSMFARARPEIVFHLAAQSLVRRGYDNPISTFETNVMGTVNILEAARHTPTLRAVVIVTSDKCYENTETHWGLRETDPLGGRDPYSSSKACAELVTTAYRRSFFATSNAPSVATARAGNVIGGGDWSEDRLVPDVARAIIEDQPVVVRNPRSLRPWQHVLEPLRGYLMLGDRLLTEGREYAQAWNFGPPNEAVLPVESLVKLLIDAFGRGSFTIAPEDRMVPEASSLRLDSTKARELLGYTQIIDLATAVRMTVSWYESQTLSPGTAIDITESQIKECIALLHQ